MRNNKIPSTFAEWIKLKEELACANKRVEEYSCLLGEIQGELEALQNEKWQPVGCEQFAAACRVCGAVKDEDNNPCHRCKREQKSGFVFDPHKYMELYGELTKKRYWIAEGCNPVRIDLMHESEELKAIKEDRDFLRRIADKALNAIVDIAEQMASGGRK